MALDSGHLAARVWLLLYGIGLLIMGIGWLVWLAFESSLWPVIVWFSWAALMTIASSLYGAGMISNSMYAKVEEGRGPRKGLRRIGLEFVLIVAPALGALIFGLYLLLRQVGRAASTHVNLGLFVISSTGIVAGLGLSYVQSSRKYADRRRCEGRDAQ